MTVTRSHYFHSTSLKQRYIDGLDVALLAKAIDAVELDWLNGITQAPVEDDPDPVRVDQLMIGDGSSNPLELSAALLLSHTQTSTANVYLFTLANGVEAFSDRASLMTTLRARFSENDVNTLFESEKVEGDPFRAQMLAIIDHQVERIGQLCEQLLKTPSLYDASTESLTEQLNQTSLKKSVDPKTHLLQVVSTRGSDAGSVAITQTLARAAFDDCCKLEPPEEVKRRFLDAQGHLASSADTLLFKQSIKEAVAGVGEQYGQSLSRFWSETWDDDRSCKDLALERYGDSLRHVLYTRRQDESLSAEMLSGVLELLQTAAGTVSSNAVLRFDKLTARMGSGAAYPLAGTFVIQSTQKSDPSLWWFSPSHELTHFADFAALTAHLSTSEGRGELRPALALIHQAALLKEDRIELEQVPILSSLVSDRVESIIALQTENLSHALTLSYDADHRVAMIDDALDVRQLLDPAQLQLDGGRWSIGAPFTFAAIWQQPRPANQSNSSSLSTDSAHPDKSPTDPKAKSDTGVWPVQTQVFDQRARRLREQGNVLQRYAEHALAPYVALLLEGQVKVAEIQVQWLTSDPGDASDVEAEPIAVSESELSLSLDLVSLLLERFSGHRSDALPPGAQLSADGATTAPVIHAELINYMLDKAAGDFTEGYLRYFKQLRNGFQREGNLSFQPSENATDLREDAMRLDFSLSKRQDWLDLDAINVIQEVLDRPSRTLRNDLGAAVTEVFSISLQFGGHSTARLCDTLVLMKSQDPAGSLTVWSCTLGWRQFASLVQLQSALHVKLSGGDRESWLQLLGETDRARLRAHLLDASDHQVELQLESINGHLAQALTQQGLSRTEQDLRMLCQRATRCRLEAGLFSSLAAAQEIDQPLNRMLDALWVRIDNSLFDAMLPQWFRAAPIEDLKRFRQLLSQYYLLSEGGKSFLFDIPTLHAYARQKVVARLKADFPQLSVDPDAVNVTMRLYETAVPAAGELPSPFAAATISRTESLTSYAINRFSEYQGAALSIDCAQADAVSSITPDYVRRLARDLDVGAAHIALLRKRLVASDPEFAVRKRMFFEQLPLMLQAEALTEKLKGKLSPEGLKFVVQALDMPDALAREPLDRKHVAISRLQLVADAGMTPDKVTGVYLFYSPMPGQNLIVMCALHCSDFVFKEYATQAALLNDIHTDDALQSLLLERVDPEVHRRYAHGGFIEPHLPFDVEAGDVPTHTPGPVWVQLIEERGNAVQLLFDDTIDLMLESDIANVVTNEQDDRAGMKYLAALGVQQALILLPGKLAALVALWQGFTWFRASAVSASIHQWGRALSEFCTALGVMISARSQPAQIRTLDERISGITEDGELAVDDEDAFDSSTTLPASSTSGWNPTALTAEQLMRLRALEVKGVALTDLKHDKLLNLYLTNSGTHYAVVEGKVYQVRQMDEGSHWTIVGTDGARGPRLRTDSKQTWQLDLTLRLRGGGGGASRMADRRLIKSAEEVLTIEASGMPDIRLRYRDRARRIGQAHLKAKQYLENCLDNINIHRRGAPLEPHVKQIIADFFGVSDPSQLLISEIERMVKGLFDAVMDPSLSPFSSERFVVGSTRPGHESIAAFVINNDPKQRVFLTEQFFNVPRYSLKPDAAAQGFDLAAHYRAANLIHELSHQALDTYDITYLESMAPFPDLLDDTSTTSFRVRSYVEALHTRKLSHLSRKSTLFTTYDNGVRRDLSPDENRGFHAILAITGSRTLLNARDAFMVNDQIRSEIILANADSVALLMLQLGRRNYLPPAP